MGEMKVLGPVVSGPALARPTADRWRARCVPIRQQVRLRSRADLSSADMTGKGGYVPPSCIRCGTTTQVSVRHGLMSESGDQRPWYCDACRWIVDTAKHDRIWGTCERCGTTSETAVILHVDRNRVHVCESCWPVWVEERRAAGDRLLSLRLFDDQVRDLVTPPDDAPLAHRVLAAPFGCLYAIGWFVAPLILMALAWLVLFGGLAMVLDWLGIDLPGGDPDAPIICYDRGGEYRCG